jgi:hypothetical protein
LQQASQQHAQKQPHITQQQLQQYWLQAQGVQQSMDDLASYAYHVASSSAKSALSLHQATWQHKQQLEAIVKQQSARLQQQAAELEVLRSLSTQQTTQLQQQEQPQQSAQQGAGLISSQDSRLQRQVEWQRQVRHPPVGSMLGKPAGVLTDTCCCSELAEPLHCIHDAQAGCSVLDKGVLWAACHAGGCCLVHQVQE